jgi:hypothetical protein
MISEEAWADAKAQMQEADERVDRFFRLGRMIAGYNAKEALFEMGAGRDG